jgi:hypothetical protein
MKNKMTAKAPISGGLDLDSFIAGADPVIEPPVAKKSTSKPPKAAKRVTVIKSGEKRPQGRPTASDEPRNERLQIRLTTKELEKLKGGAGIASVSAFVRQMMEEKGII